jgi:hypothetical protein
MLDTEPLILADPARGLEPPRERSRARLDALLAAEATPRRPRRRPVRVAAGLAALAALAAVAAASLPGSTNPAEAFANRLQGDGIVHMVLAHERTHDASGDGVNPRQDELWISLADGSWRLRIRLYGNTIDTTFDGRTVTVHDSRTGKTTTDTPSDPEALKGHPFGGPSVAPLSDPHFKIAGETSIDGETVYDLVPTQGLPDGLELHWYVSKDGKLRRMVQSAPDVIDEPTGARGPASLSTDVDTYEVLANTPANQELLRQWVP